MKKNTLLALIVMTLLAVVLLPKGVLAVQSGGGYTVYDRMDPVSGAISGGPASGHAGGTPISQSSSGNGYTSVGGISGAGGSNAGGGSGVTPGSSPSVSHGGGGTGSGTLADANSTSALANSPDLNSLQGIIPKGSGTSGPGGSIYINSLTVNNNGAPADAKQNLFDVSGQASPKTNTTTILYIIGAFIGGLILGAIVLELFELIVIRIVGAKRGKENS